MSEAVGFFSGLAKSLKGELVRSRENLVPSALQFLWEVTRFIVPYGGRSSTKSWSIGRVLLVCASESTLRILCCREIQGSIKESAYRLLLDQIELLGLSDFYDVGADSITGKNGSRFFFEGLRYNTSRIRSYEGIDICWVEEAQAVSEMSWETLLPTIRKPGSRFFISFNPLTPDDPVLRRFVNNTPPGTIARKVSFRDNPYLSAESEAERQWLELTDPDSYRHVWEGEPRTVSDALILKGKFFVESFEVQTNWAGPYHGLDYGFSRDPSAGVRCYIDDSTRTLYITHEFWRLACDIDLLPSALESAIPGISTHVVYCDSARPETTSYLSRNGLPDARGAQKWPGSVDDGVMYLRAFTRIVIAPSCTHMIDEARSYSFKTDRLTGAPLPEVEDKHNHCIDALRYALWPLIRNQSPGGYFSRAALLVKGQPVEKVAVARQVFGVLAATDRPGTSVGFVIFATSPDDMQEQLLVCDYLLAEIDDAMSIPWLEAAYAQVRALAVQHRAYAPGPPVIFVEPNEFGAAVFTNCLQHSYAQRDTSSMINVEQIRLDGQACPTLDERAAAIRSAVNGRGFVKLSRTAFNHQLTHRSTTSNHLLSQIFSYRQNAKDSPQELAAAFAIGVSLCIGP